MKRIEQVILIITFLGFSWLAMQATHELGHVVGAWATGAEINKVALHPCIFSRTDIGRNPHPSIVVWTGPIIGSMLPLLVFLTARLCRCPGLYLFRFFAGFCLIANGMYIAFGPSKGAVDTAIMLRHGSSRWIMVIFGICTVSLGLCFWHRQGPHFGLAVAGGKVNRQAVIVSVALLMAIVTVELIINSK